MNSKTDPRVVNKLSIAMVLCLGIFLVGCAVEPVDARVDSASLDTVMVTGLGVAYGPPDMATIQFGYTTSSEAIGEALEQSNVTIENISAALIEFGIAETDIQTTNFSVWPEDQYDPMTGMPTGVKRYRVENTLQVVIRDIEIVSDVIEAALVRGANNVYGLTFSIEDTSQLASQARANALADGRTRAEQIVQELGLQLGEARTISESFDGGVFLASSDFARGLGGGGGAPPISEGQMGVRVQVMLTFDLLR